MIFENQLKPSTIWEIKKTIDEANLRIPKLAKVVLKKKIKGTFIEELVTESKLL